ncbi:maltose ABC transporter substrate-binding protein [Paenibacillus sp.]|uniref:sugar ABC transporter substrate-binding protein n=1 Tax=Paenibacillus sp. TaxID=58172 RepID=UPI002D6B0CF1|nr:maltose ABC transporter substrate-binding protein [Paenibacillus sp.]HZG85036.1 maltose ABC transporter substrate-binding protein [Paenibacillus sp.]
METKTKVRFGLGKLTMIILSIGCLLAACAKPPSAVPPASTEPQQQQTEQTKPETEANGGTDTAENQASAEEELQPEEGAELLLWDNGEAEGEWAQYVAQEFTKKYGIPVKYEKVQHTDVPTKLQTDGPAGLGGDVFLAPHDHTGSMVAAGLVLENFFPDEYREAALEAAVNGTSVDGKLYGYPVSIETYALFYNKDLVQQPPATWEELIEQAKAFNDPAAQKYGFMYEAGNFYYNYALIGGYGGYVFGGGNTDPQDIGLNTEGAVKAGELMKRLQSEVLPLKVEDITYDVKQSLFNEGKLLFNIDGPWALANHRGAGVNFGVAPLPKLDNGQSPTSFSGVKQYLVNAYTKYPNAASLYAKFATSDEMLLKRYEMTGQIPARKTLLENETLKKDEIAMAFLTQANEAVPMPNIPEMALVWGPMATALTAIWNGLEEPKPALDAAVQQIKDAIASQ